MSHDPSTHQPARPGDPVLTRRGWQSLPVVRTHHDALGAGFRPGEYRTGHDTYDRYLARCGHPTAPIEERLLLVEQGEGVTVRLEIERTTRPPVTPIEVRRALERLLRAALEDVAAARGA